MDFYEQIFENNKNWVSGKLNTDSSFFDKMASGQSPDMLYIGCSDSRVSAEEVTGAKPGQMFVHRNIANLVPNNDNNSASVIEYAIGHLKVKHVVVCGHYMCGGIKAAMEPLDLGILNPWLRTIRDVYRMHKVELNSITDETERYNRLVELNVEEQCVNVIKMAVFQREFLQTGQPSIHGWVFDVHTGKLVDLKININEKLKDIREIYDLGIKK